MHDLIQNYIDRYKEHKLQCEISNYEGNKNYVCTLTTRKITKSKYGYILKSHFGFKTFSELFEYCDKELEKLDKELKNKKIKKEQQRLEKLLITANANIQVGDIFVCSWGYGQTNVNFHQVLSKNSLTIEYREIHKISVKETSWCSDEVIPDVDNFVENAELQKARLSGKSFKCYYGTARKIDDINSTFYRSWGY